MAEPDAAPGRQARMVLRPTELRLALLVGVLLSAGAVILLGPPATPPLAGGSPPAPTRSVDLDMLLTGLAVALATGPGSPRVIDNATPASVSALCDCPWVTGLSPGSDVLLLSGDQAEGPTAYFVRAYSRRPGDNQTVLCRYGPPASARGVMETTCPGVIVDQMQIELGLDQDGDGLPDRFLTAARFPASASPTALRLLLLAREARMTPDRRNQRTFQLSNGETITPGDGYERRLTSRLLTVGGQNRATTGPAGGPAVAGPGP